MLTLLKLYLFCSQALSLGNILHLGTPRDPRTGDFGFEGDLGHILKLCVKNKIEKKKKTHISPQLKF